MLLTITWTDYSTVQPSATFQRLSLAFDATSLMDGSYQNSLCLGGPKKRREKKLHTHNNRKKSDASRQLEIYRHLSFLGICHVLPRSATDRPRSAGEETRSINMTVEQESRVLVSLVHLVNRTLAISKESRRSAMTNELVCKEKTGQGSLYMYTLCCTVYTCVQ
jgi:hypothetical protein